jgi:hypothetical protein
LSFPKILFLGGLGLFAIIGTLALVKKISKPSAETSLASMPAKVIAPQVVAQRPVEKKVLPSAKISSEIPQKEDFPNIDRINQLFTTSGSQLPIVETITYSSSVPWLKGRPAWLADYAAHYATSRHFIARTLNGKPDYFTQKVFPGSKFNVFRKDKRIQFYLLVDVSRCKMGFYYVDLDTKERVLLKTYRVGVGRLDPQSPSGCLTPLGSYSLGSKVAIYKPGTTGVFKDQKVEMISVFGTRWIPFHEVLEGNATAKGYGVHGAPWKLDAKQSQFVENKECVGKHESDGSIFLASEDMEELFSITITKPTVVVVVKDFHEAKLPGVEVATPTGTGER